jgi:hypothetical protein
MTGYCELEQLPEVTVPVGVVTWLQPLESETTTPTLVVTADPLLFVVTVAPGVVIVEPLGLFVTVALEVEVVEVFEPLMADTLLCDVFVSTVPEDLSLMLPVAVAEALPEPSEELLD